MTVINLNEALATLFQDEWTSSVSIGERSNVNWIGANAVSRHESELYDRRIFLVKKFISFALLHEPIIPKQIFG